MQVTVEFFGPLREFRPPDVEGEVFARPIEAGTTVGGVLGSLKVPEDKPLIILLNSTHAERDETLKDGDVLEVAPLIAGGCGREVL